MQKSAEVTRVENFGLLGTRLKPSDHLVVIGHNEARNCFFMFDRRQLRECIKQLDWGVLEAHQPVKKVTGVMKAVDDHWHMQSECWYHKSYAINHPVIVRYHLIGLRSFAVPEKVRAGQTKIPLGYYEFTSDNLAELGFSSGLQPLVAEVLQILAGDKCLM